MWFARTRDFETLLRIQLVDILLAPTLSMIPIGGITPSGGVGIWGIMAPLGYVLAPQLLELVHATPAVKAEALPFLRTMFVFSLGMLLFFMLGGALRAAGDARTPLRLGIWMTVLNITFNVILIPGLGPIPALGTRGAAIGTVSASTIVSAAAIWMILRGHMVVHFPRSMSWRPDWQIIRSLFRFGLPAGIQGVAMNIAGVLLLRFIGSLPDSAEAQAAYAVGYAELFSLITWTSVGLMGAAAAVAGQNLGAGKPERAILGVRIASRIGLGVAYQGAAGKEAQTHARSSRGDRTAPPPIRQVPGAVYSPPDFRPRPPVSL